VCWFCETVNERSGVVGCDKGELIPLENVKFFFFKPTRRTLKRPPVAKASSPIFKIFAFSILALIAK